MGATKRQSFKIGLFRKGITNTVLQKNDDLKIVIPNSGNEIPNKYIIYSSPPPRGQDGQSKGSDVIPNQKGYSVSKVTQ